MDNLYTDDYIKKEVASAWDWMTQKHDRDEWDRFIFALGLMYLHSTDSTHIMALAVLDQATMRKILLFGE